MRSTSQANHTVSQAAVVPAVADGAVAVTADARAPHAGLGAGLGDAGRLSPVVAGAGCVGVGGSRAVTRVAHTCIVLYCIVSYCTVSPKIAHRGGSDPYHRRIPGSTSRSWG